MTDSKSGTRVRRTFTVRNRRDADLAVVLEPWASEYVLRPNEMLEIVEETQEPGTKLEIEVEATHLVFYASTGSILRAYRDGEELP